MYNSHQRRFQVAISSADIRWRYRLRISGGDIVCGYSHVHHNRLRFEFFVVGLFVQMKHRKDAVSGCRVYKVGYRVYDVGCLLSVIVIIVVSLHNRNHRAP